MYLCFPTAFSERFNYWLIVTCTNANEYNGFILPIKMVGILTTLLVNVYLNFPVNCVYTCGKTRVQTLLKKLKNDAILCADSLYVCMNIH